MLRVGFHPSVELLEDRRLPASFTVWNTADEGAGSFRQAILDANAHANQDQPDQIVFRIMEVREPVIRPGSPLPAILDSVIIDGRTQPGFGYGPRVVLDGRDAGFGDGLRLSSGGNTIRSLAIGGFAGAGVWVDSDDNILAENHLGAHGKATVGNGIGLVIAGSHNRIGTNGNRVGDRVEGNRIAGNRGAGVVIVPQAELPDVGGSGEAPPEEESEETNDEPSLQLAEQHNLVAGNRIKGNGFQGQVRIVAEAHVVTQTVSRYVPITVCDDDGCHTEYVLEVRQIQVPVLRFVPVIEVAATGSVSPGILISGNANEIGGNGALGNKIGGNGGAGVAVGRLGFFVSFTGNRIRGNAFCANGGPSIDLGEDGVSFNDPGDQDAGPNQGQNFPTIRQVQHGRTTRIQGSLHSLPLSTFTIDFYAGEAGFGNRQRYLGAAEVNTDAEGNASFAVQLPKETSSNEAIAATATDAAGNTSELSFAPLGTVTVWQAAGQLFVTGSSSTAQAVRVAAVPGESQAFEVTDGCTTRTFAGVTSGVHISMLGSQNNAVFLDGTTAPWAVDGPVTVFTTDGDDSLWGHQLRVQGPMHIQLGEGNDRVCLVDTFLAGELALATGDGNDRVSIDAMPVPASSFHGPVEIGAGAGDDYLELGRLDDSAMPNGRLSFHETLQIDGGPGIDRLLGAALVTQEPEFDGIEDDWFVQLADEEPFPPAP